MSKFSFSTACEIIGTKGIIQFDSQTGIPLKTYSQSAIMNSDPYDEDGYYLELDSYLFSKDNESVEQIKPILKQPVRSYVAVGSVIMATLGLTYASEISALNGVKIALNAAALTASLPPVEFYNSTKLGDYISKNYNIKQ